MKSFDTWKPQETELDEALSVAARLKISKRMSRLSGKIQRGKQRKQRRMADRQQLQKRALVAARNALTKKLTGGTPKEELSVQQRVSVSKKLEAKSAVIKKMARKLFPELVKKERERLASFKASLTDDN